MRWRWWIVLPVLFASGALARPLDPPERPVSPRAVSDAVALVPLDSRPATSSLPVRVAAVGGVEVVIPPVALLGDARRGADLEHLWQWIFDANARALVVSLDALAYGGLVQSRSSEHSAENAWNRLWWLRLWRDTTGRPVYAFITIPRSPDARDRPRNLEVIRRALDWAADGTLARLYIAWDDALPGSPAPAEGAQLRSEVESRGLENVLVYPGADEVATTLISRMTLEERGARPKATVEYSDPGRADEIIRYDGLPLRESVRSQARAAGLEIADEARADFTLYLFNGGDMRRAAVRLSVLARRGPVALVDIAFVNKASSPLVNDIVVLERYLGLYAFAAWGTPGNNLGTALAQAGLRAQHGSGPASIDLLARQYVNDYVYSSLVRDEVRRRWPESELGSSEASAGLLELLRATFGPRAPSGGYCISITGADFPWARSFEVRFDLEVVPKQGAGCP